MPIIYLLNDNLLIMKQIIQDAMNVINAIIMIEIRPVKELIIGKFHIISLITKM